MSDTFDYIIVGSGINSLCCAALLAKKGNTVCLLERESEFGGCIRSAELTLPGFRHDMLSGFHPLFVTSPSYAILAEDLAHHGLIYENSHKATATIGSSGNAAILSQSREENVQSFNRIHAGDGDRYQQAMLEMEVDAELTFSLLGNEPRRWGTVWAIIKALKSMGWQGLLRFFGEAMGSSRDWLTTYFRSDVLHALLAPWVLHTGLGPDANFSGPMNRLIAFSLESAGMPVVKGGSDKLVEALVATIRQYGGTLWTDADVTEVLVERGAATGVVIQHLQQNVSGASVACPYSELHANKAVICNVTPDQLYLSLLSPKWVPQGVREAAQNFQFGRACMQIHLALDAPPQWILPELADVAMVHVCDGLAAVSRAVNQAENGLLPEEATIVVGQPSALDNSRAPEGKAVLWLQLQELPRVIQGDAAKSIDVPEDGSWSEEVREAYADRIVDRLGHYIGNLSEVMLARTVLSPADLEAANRNLVGGDPYSGHCGIQQFFFWRPLKQTKNHHTTVKNLYHIGASTHPGPGLGGNSGYMVAQLLG
ncbi:MAG: NAD(P)/FAD-dependent oxidoreductase [Pseudomonadota bacterium]